MNNKFENAENPNYTSETITADELIQIIYRNENIPQDSRFSLIENGGVFKYFNILDILNNQKNKFYSIINVGNKIIGLCELEKSPYQEKVFWIKFLSIDQEYQGQGYASKLAEEIFRFAKQEHYTLEGSSYSDEGDKKLKPLFNKMAEKYLVNFIDKNKL
jgi:RimJ/RimL family protein N-acetyltransferase